MMVAVAHLQEGDRIVGLTARVFAVEARAGYEESHMYISLDWFGEDQYREVRQQVAALIESLPETAPRTGEGFSGFDALQPDTDSALALRKTSLVEVVRR